MLLSKMIGAQVTCKSDPEIHGSCVDFFLDTSDGKIIYTLAHVIEDGSHRPALLRMKNATLDEDEGIIFDDVGDVASQIPVDMDTGPLDLTNLPPLVVGPFGYTFAPALLGAIFNDTASGYADIERPEIAENQQWHWFSHLVGLPVFDTTKELGTVSDIGTRGANPECENLIVQEDDAETGYPFWMLRDVARGETSLKLERHRPEPWSAEGIAKSLDGA